nr:PEP-CTERM sorting domain-containing protein [Armatimonas sp.]
MRITRFSLTRGTLAALTLLGLAALPQAARAVPITYTLTGIGGSGTFNAVPFSGANFTLIGIGDTTATTTVSGFPAITLTSMTYDITGVTAGPATTTGTFKMVNANSFIPNLLAFTNTGSEGTGFLAAGAGAWNLTSNFGPLASTQQVVWAAFPTNQGTLQFTSVAWTSATFTAVVGGGGAAPEPGTLALLALGGACAFARRRRCIAR